MENVAEIHGEVDRDDEERAQESVKLVGPTALEREATRLGKDLHGIRKAAGLSRHQLARRLDWPVSTVRRIERGDRLAGRDEVVEWARTTGAADNVASELIDRAASQEGLAAQEMSALAEGTAKAFFQHFLDMALTAHHLGLAVMVVKWAHRIWQWSKFVYGEGELDVDMPISLGCGVELDLSVHVDDDPNGTQPPLTICFAPSGDSSVGVLTFGLFQVSPTSGYAEPSDDPLSPEKHTGGLYAGQFGMQQPANSPTRMPTVPMVQLEGPVVAITQDLSDVLQVEGSEARIARLCDWSEKWLVSELTKSPWLRLTNADLVILYDPVTRVLIWVHLRARSHPSWRVTIRPENLGHGDAKIAFTVRHRRQSNLPIASLSLRH